MKRKTCKGFTLLELLVVILIIGILAAVALPQYKKVILKSKFAAIKDSTRVIFEAEQRYYIVHNAYTTNWDDLDITVNTNCSIHAPYSYVFCNVTDKNGNYLIQYVLIPPNKKIRCDAWPADQNNLTNQICQEETGRKTPNSCNGTSYCIYIK